MHYYNRKYSDKCMFGKTEWALHAQKHHILPHVIVNGNYPILSTHLVLTRIVKNDQFIYLNGDDKLQYNNNTEMKYKDV